MNCERFRRLLLVLWAPEVIHLVNVIRFPSGGGGDDVGSFPHDRLAVSTVSPIVYSFRGFSF